MTKLADPSMCDFASGMQLELVWSKDESVVDLFITLPVIGQPDVSEVTKLKMTPLQLDELRGFIMDNID